MGAMSTPTPFGPPPGMPPGGPPPPATPPPAMQPVDFIAPVHVRNGLAFASGWLGILSFVCFGPLLGIPAIITGVLALGRPEKGGQGRAWTGIVAGSITTVLYSLLFVLRMLL